ncbi:MAG: TetR/AcrR family transcriptional regulator [Actinomycetota bacterium]
MPPATTDTPRATVGRPRDHSIDAAVLDETLRQLARDGYAGLSLASIAEAAGTTRPAIYRRWSDKAALVVDAIAELARVEPPDLSGAPFDDFVAELEHFRHCITAAGSLPVAGLMLTDGVDDAIRQRYLDDVVTPRRARFRGLLADAVDAGELDADADLAIAGTFATGSWYSMALAAADVPDDWARRAAALIWRSCGGEPPT